MQDEEADWKRRPLSTSRTSVLVLRKMAAIKAFTTQRSEFRTSASGKTPRVVRGLKCSPFPGEERRSPGFAGGQLVPGSVRDPSEGNKATGKSRRHPSLPLPLRHRQTQTHMSICEIMYVQNSLRFMKLSVVHKNTEKHSLRKESVAGGIFKTTKG